MPEHREIRHFTDAEADAAGLDGEGWYWYCEDAWLGPFSCELAAEDNAEDYFD